jgi:nucleoside-triphosphatase
MQGGVVASQCTESVLLTGRPGCGKTTVIRGLLDRLNDFRLRGFYTEEIREQGQRVGFKAIGLSGQEAILAHVQSRSKLRVGRYGVEPGQLDPLVKAELEGPMDSTDLIALDEIGRMELFCPPFVQAVVRLLGDPVPVVATVALKGQGLIAAVKDRADVRLVEVSEKNRDRLPEDLEKWARDLKERGQSRGPSIPG